MYAVHSPESQEYFLVKLVHKVKSDTTTWSALHMRGTKIFDWPIAQWVVAYFGFFWAKDPFYF